VYEVYTALRYVTQAAITHARAVPAQRSCALQRATYTGTYAAEPLTSQMLTEK
jgi:hypothetical protein